MRPYHTVKSGIRTGCQAFLCARAPEPREILGFLFLFFCTGFAAAVAQTRLSGVVRDAENGKPLDFVSVAVKGTTVGIATDAQGKFALALPAGATTLVVSYVGYDTQEVEIKGRRHIDVSLQKSYL